MERTIKELNGECWLEIDEMMPASKQVMSSRSFGARVTELADLEQAISFHAANAAQRMRKQGLYCSAVYVFIQNSPFDQAAYYGNGLSIGLPAPTDCTMQINKAALWLLKRMYKPDIYYQKAGVMLMELVPPAGKQSDLFGYTNKDSKAFKLMQTIDAINDKYRRGTVRLAGEGYKQAWSMRRGFKSPNYTGDWKELPRVMK